MNQLREKTCSRKKYFFQGRGGEYFPDFRGELTKKCVCLCVCGRGVGVGGWSTFIFRGRLLYVGGKSFSRGRGLEECCPLWLPFIYFTCTFRICHQTKFSKLWKMLLVSHKMIFCKNEAVCPCVYYGETCQRICKLARTTI